MMKLHYTAVEVQNASLSTFADRSLEVSLMGATESAERKKAWLVIFNVSPHLFQILDEEGSVLAIVYPWSETIWSMPPANARRQIFTHWVSKLSSAANAAQGFWMQYTTVEPVPSNVFISS